MADGAGARCDAGTTGAARAQVVRIKADLTLVNAAKNFMDTWLIRRNYDAAFRYLSTRSYACYDLDARS